jgi:hypothetical protein
MESRSWTLRRSPWLYGFELLNDYTGSNTWQGAQQKVEARYGLAERRNLGRLHPVQDEHEHCSGKG